MLFIMVSMPWANLQTSKQQLTEKTNFVGDSLEIGRSHPEINDIYKRLQWWLTQNFQGPFEDLGGTMEHGIQRDTTSCGITTVNMLAHKALRDHLWNVSQKDSERVQWFNRLVKQQISVSWFLLGSIDQELTED